MRKYIAKYHRRFANALDPLPIGGYVKIPFNPGPPELVIDGKKLTDLVMRNAILRIKERQGIVK